MTAYTCTKCRQMKPLTEFYRDGSKPMGHMSRCSVCVADARRRKLAADPEQRERERAHTRTSYHRHTAKRREEMAARYRAQPERRAEYNKLYYAAHREEYAQRYAAYYEANYDTLVARAGLHAKVRLRRAGDARAILDAHPEWKPEIAAIYRRARLLSKLTGKPHHVDHIVPLIAKTVCGLHIPSNLRIVPADENLSKGNRHWPEMP